MNYKVVFPVVRVPAAAARSSVHQFFHWSDQSYGQHAKK